MARKAAAGAGARLDGGGIVLTRKQFISSVEVI